MSDSPHVVQVSAQTFDALVIEGSRDRPVLVDFWADWCAPCRMLMPILAKLAEEYRGKFLVAKVNTEEEQALAAEFGIRSLPTVQLFKDGRPVDQFMGALPESEVRAFLERHLPRESDGLLTRAQAALAANQIARAQAYVEEARAHDPENPRLDLLQAQIAFALGNPREAQEKLARLPLDLAQDPEVLNLRSRVHFAQVLEQAPPESELEARLAQNPEDSEALYQRAAYRAVHGDYEAALETFLRLLKQDRSYGEDGARKAMIMLFEQLGGDSPLVSRYRAKMLNALY